MNRKRDHFRIATIAAVLLVFAGTLLAAPPHPTLVEKAQREGIPAASLSLPHELGTCQPDSFFTNFLRAKRASGDVALSPNASSFKILALLVDFSDQVSQVNATYFDSLIFDSSGGITIRDYFDDVSYGQLDLVTVDLPSSVGWSRAPQTYAYYVDGQRGIGSYPQNAQGLVSDLVDIVDPAVDFSQYDNDGNGYVDVLLVIHSGTGYELSGDVNDIHSHKWSLPSPKSKDGVYVWSYTVQPEFWLFPGDMTIGVYAHELCHGFGLPDLYDTDYSSNGIGRWGIMATGSWNGPNGLGGSPANPCAWSRVNMGFASPTSVTGNMTAVQVDPVETGGTIYRLPTLTADPNEYFLVENRQKVGYDTYIPSSGLLIWHIDDNKSGNTQEWWPGQNNLSHYRVALEPGDANWDLEKGLDNGDSGDPFPGSTLNTNFNASSAPNSNNYDDSSLITSVNNIVAVGSTIFADFIVGTVSSVTGTDDGLLPEEVQLSQNYPNPFNPTTVIEFSVDRSAEVTVSVYNTLGQHVATLLDQEVPAGPHSINWDATDRHGSELASGMYLYRLTVDEVEVTKKMILVR